MPNTIRMPYPRPQLNTRRFVNEINACIFCNYIFARLLLLLLLDDNDNSCTYIALGLNLVNSMFFNPQSTISMGCL